MNLVLLGPPGVGKGTQARVLAAKFGLTPVASGDLIRAEMAENTALGQEARKYMEAGNLVPDDLIIRMVQVLLTRETIGGFLLDGFPRTIAQAEDLDRMLQVLGRTVFAALCLVVSEEKVVSRLSNRRMCPVCNRVYNLLHLAPHVAGRCDDHPEAELVLRSDDRPETVRHRLNVYQAQTAPLIDYYRRRGLLRQVDGDGPVEDVTRRIEACISG